MYGPYHSCHVGTPSIPRFSSVQLLSSCFAAWLKYRPSVDSDACVKEMTAVPAEPEKPEMNSAIEKWLTVSMYSEEQVEWSGLLTSATITRGNVLGLVAVFGG